jgi:polysaccharide pyruvyl transferase WcaK-like protein
MKRILLVSSWQTVNIGDVGHTPGVLALLEAHLPGVEVLLRPHAVGDGVKAMLLRRFPKLNLVEGPEAEADAFLTCTFLLHGSGPYLVGQDLVQRWLEETGKPFGVFGITLPPSRREAVSLLGHSAFTGFRDPDSLALAQAHGLTDDRFFFGPDGAFAVDLADDDGAAAFLEEVGLEPGTFYCCIPRWRNTPYWEIKDRPFDPDKEARNRARVEQDHAPLIDGICRIVRETGKRVLLCPEDRSQVALARTAILERLPDDVRRRVACRNRFWLTDEAVSVYRQSLGVFGLEMHSPIMALGNGVPALVGRFAEQTSKGTMWRAIGLSDWLFDLDLEADRARYPEAIAGLAADPEAARHKAHAARECVRRLQNAMVQRLASCLAS